MSHLSEITTTKPDKPGIRFTPWKALIGLLLFLGGVCLVAVVHWGMPDEAAPAIVTAVNGDQTFVLQSLKDELSPTAFLVGIAVSMTIALRYFPRDKVYEERARAYELHNEKMPILLKVVIGALLSMAGLLLGMVLIWLPLTRFRSVTVSSGRVTMTSAYWSWSIPRSEVGEIDVRRKRDEGKGRENLQLVIQERSGKRHASASCPGHAEYVTFLQNLRDQLQQARPD